MKKYTVLLKLNDSTNQYKKIGPDLANGRYGRNGKLLFYVCL